MTGETVSHFVLFTMEIPHSVPLDWTLFSFGFQESVGAVAGLCCEGIVLS